MGLSYDRVRCSRAISGSANPERFSRLLLYGARSISEISRARTFMHWVRCPFEAALCRLRTACVDSLLGRVGQPTTDAIDEVLERVKQDHPGAQQICWLNLRYVLFSIRANMSEIYDTVYFQGRSLSCILMGSRIACAGRTFLFGI